MYQCLKRVCSFFVFCLVQHIPFQPRSASCYRLPPCVADDSERERVLLDETRKNKKASPVVGSSGDSSRANSFFRYFRCLPERNQETKENVLGEQELLLPTLQSRIHLEEKHDQASATRVRNGAQVSVPLLRQAVQVHAEHLRSHQEVSSRTSALLQTALLNSISAFSSHPYLPYRCTCATIPINFFPKYEFISFSTEATSGRENSPRGEDLSLNSVGKSTSRRLAFLPPSFTNRTGDLDFR